MGSIARVSRKRQVVVPREAREALGVGAGDKLVVEVEKGRFSIRPRPGGYAKHMLGLHKGVWKGVKTKEHVDRERRAWGRGASSRGGSRLRSPSQAGEQFKVSDICG